MGKHSLPEDLQDEANIEWLHRAMHSDPRRSPDSRCWNFEDGLDGYAIHHPDCPHVGSSASSGTSCVGGYPPTFSRGYVPEWAR